MSEGGTLNRVTESCMQLFQEKIILDCYNKTLYINVNYKLIRFALNVYHYIRAINFISRAYFSDCTSMEQMYQVNFFPLLAVPFPKRQVIPSIESLRNTNDVIDTRNVTLTGLQSYRMCFISTRKPPLMISFKWHEGQGEADVYRQIHDKKRVFKDLHETLPCQLTLHVMMIALCNYSFTCFAGFKDVSRTGLPSNVTSRN